MIQTNASFDAANALLGKKPIYVLSIAGEKSTDPPEAIYSTHNLQAEGVPDFPPAAKPWLKTPRGASQTIDVVRGSSSIGELECEVVDQQGAVRTLVGTKTLEGRAATLRVGYPGMLYFNFVALHTYQLYKITISKSYTSWLFRSRDRQMSKKRTIYAHPENGKAISEANPWILAGTPAEIMQGVYLFGLGRPDTELDRAGLAALDSGAQGLYKAVRPFLFVLTEPVEAKQFLETEVYKIAGLYPVVDNLGSISLRAFRPPAAGPVAVYTLDENNMMVLPEIDRMPIINEIVFKLDRKPGGGGDPQNELIFVDGVSISTYGRAGQQVMDSKGLRSSLGAQWFCQEVATRLFRRFAGTPTSLRGGAPVVRIESFLLTLPVWVGDYVNVTHAKMPDLTSGALGVTNRLYEVIDREPDYTRGRMRYKLLDTGLTGAEGARQWAPSGRDFVVEASAIY